MVRFMFCPKCGKGLREGAAFCNGCGAQLQNEVIANNEVSVPSKRWNLFVISALIGLGGFLLLSLIIRIMTNRFGMLVTEAFSTASIIYGVSSVIILAVGAFAYSKCGRNKKMPCIISAALELLLMAVLLVFSNIILRLLHINVDVFGECAFVLRIASLTGAISTIIAGMIGLFIKKKNIKPDIIIYSTVLFISLIIVLVASYIFHLGIGFIAISIGLYLPFITILPCSLQEPTAKVINRTTQVPTMRQIMFCPNCGTRFPNGKKFCDQCGSELKETTITENISFNQVNPQDAKSTGFGVLGFFFPVVGLILYLVWKDTMPLRAKSTGKGALAGAITGVALTILIYVVYFIIIASLF